MAKVQLNVRVEQSLVNELRSQALVRGERFGAYVERLLRDTIEVPVEAEPWRDDVASLDRRLARLEELAGL